MIAGKALIQKAIDGKQILLDVKNFLVQSITAQKVLGPISGDKLLLAGLQYFAADCVNPFYSEVGGLQKKTSDTKSKFQISDENFPTIFYAKCDHFEVINY